MRRNYREEMHLWDFVLDSFAFLPYRDGMTHMKRKIKEERHMPYCGWRLSEDSRETLLRFFPPIFPDVIAHHVTLETDNRHIPDNAEIEIVGYVRNDTIEAMVVSVNGETTRPDGSVYHITWSIDRDRGATPAQAGELAKQGWEYRHPCCVETTPFFRDYSGEEITTAFSELE